MLVASDQSTPSPFGSRSLVVPFNKIGPFGLWSTSEKGILRKHQQGSVLHSTCNVLDTIVGFYFNTLFFHSPCIVVHYYDMKHESCILNLIMQHNLCVGFGGGKFESRELQCSVTVQLRRL